MPTPACAVHKHRDTVPLDVHHVWPKAQGGPDIASNRIIVCPNGHRRIHDYIRLMQKTDGKPVWIKRRLFGAKVRFFGAAGYVAIINAGSQT